MRKIGHLDKYSDATVLSDYLYAQGITNEVEGDELDGGDIWVHDEDMLEQSKLCFDAFISNPSEAKYLDASKMASNLRHKELQNKKKLKKQVHGRSSIMNASVFSIAPVTFILIIISIVVTIVGGMGSGSPITKWLSITSYTVSEEFMKWDSSLPEIMHGQVWRLVTPIFIHASIMKSSYGLIHLLFNMMWLKELGRMLETAQGKKGLLWKVIVIAVLSNLGQFFYAGPSFGGMSGVVFGLLGYCWMRGKFDLTSGLYVQQQTATFMFVWFFLCLFGVIGGIANGAHAVGLVTGIAWGYISAMRVNRKS